MTVQYERIPVPGFTSPTESYTDREILYSAGGRFTQKGVTLAGGQGVLLAGQLLARKTSDKLYYAYATGGSGGMDIAKGVLRRSCDTGVSGTTVTQQANMVISGILKANLIVGSDAGALVDLGASTDSVLNTYKL